MMSDFCPAWTEAASREFDLAGVVAHGRKEQPAVMLP
jgi:hypothetical protein